jgi:hypothetical protein
MYIFSSYNGINRIFKKCYKFVITKYVFFSITDAIYHEIHGGYDAVLPQILFEQQNNSVKSLVIEFFGIFFFVNLNCNVAG